MSARNNSYRIDQAPTDIFDASKTLNGAKDPYRVLSSLNGNLESVFDALANGGFFGWDIRTLPTSSMDERGMYDGGDTFRHIVGNLPEGGQVLGWASKNWQPIQVEQTVPLLEALAGRGLKLVSAIPGPVTRFTFDGSAIDVVPGKHYGFVPADGSKPVVGDVVRDRFVVDLGNTGKTSLSVKHRPQRWVCANGLVGDSTMGEVRIHHSSLAPSNIDKAVDLIIGRGNEWLTGFIEEARQLILTRMTLDQAMQLWGEALKWKEPEELESKRSVSMQEREQHKVIDLFGSPTNAQVYKGTAWAAYNALVEYLDHGSIVREHKGSLSAGRARRVVSGQDDSTKKLGWRRALEFAAAAA